MRLVAAFVLLGCAITQVGMAQESPSRAMARAVIQQPAGMISTTGHQGTWAYEEGMLLDGMAAEWHTTADGADFHYIKAAVDQYVAADGTIIGSKAEGHGLDEIEMGRAVLLVYRVTQQPKYYKAAKFLHDELAARPSVPAGGHGGQIDPGMRSIEAGYLTQPFRAAYAATFQESGDFDGIAKQMLLIEERLREPKKAGSPEAMRLQMGWYEMALVDVLDWMPNNHPERGALIAALRRTSASAVKAQDRKTGLWQQASHQDANAGNETVASTSCMFVYALAKGVRKGYLPQAYAADARRGWEAIQNKFSSMGANGIAVDHLATKSAVSDAVGTGVFLKAGSEMEQASTEALGQGKTVMVDAWFNSQTRKNAAGQTELFHYKWNVDTNDGFAFFGRVFERYGARLATEKTAPVSADLRKAQIYVLVSPDIPAKNPEPHYMDRASADVIAEWVKGGGVLLMMENDPANADIEHFNTLSDLFGIHFNPVLVNHVIGNDHPAGNVQIPAGAGVFERPHLAYMKDTCSITVSRSAKAAVTKGGNVMIAVARYGKGTVFAVVDPWVYNEYVDHRNHLPLEYDNFEGAIDLAGWAVRRASGPR